MNDAQALTLAELAIADYAPIRSAYKMEIAGHILEYLLTDNARITKFKNGFKKAIANAFDEAYSQGFTDGGSSYPDGAEPGDIEWLASKINAELGFVDMLFTQLKAFKADEDTTQEEYQAEAAKRAEGYARTLDGVYNEGKVRGAKNQILEFGGQDGAESCPECTKLKGQKHRASWWIRRGLVPGQPGNKNFTCGGFQCQHFLWNPKTGQVFTI
jgi:hypothetical protein